MKKTLLALGVVGLGSLIASPASAQQAYGSGSATIVLMNGASQSIGAEIAAPSGVGFDTSAGIVTTPALQGATANLSDNVVLFDTLTVNPGAITAPPANSSFTAAAATELSTAVGIDEVVSIIRAGAGVDGLD